jgi:hypothetical protein
MLVVNSAIGNFTVGRISSNKHLILSGLIQKFIARNILTCDLRYLKVLGIMHSKRYSRGQLKVNVPFRCTIGDRSRFHTIPWVITCTHPSFLRSRKRLIGRRDHTAIIDCSQYRIIETSFRKP